MAWITVTGVKPYDGRYLLDLAGPDGLTLTTREWGWVKRLTGYLPLTIEEGWDGADPELFAVFAAIALHRADRVDTKEVPAVYERIADAPFGNTITLEPDPDQDEEEGDDSPPPRRPDASSSSSGAGSTTSSATSPEPQNGSGTPDSDTSASDLTRSAT